MKNYSAKEFEKLLSDNGWTYDHQTGDHKIYYKNGKHVSVPIRKKNPMLFRRLIKENGLEVD